MYNMTLLFNELKSGDRIKTRYSGMATVIETAKKFLIDSGIVEPKIIYV